MAHPTTKVQLDRRYVQPGSLYASLLLADAIAEIAADAPGPVLDVGCGRSPYRKLFAGEYFVGVDLPETLPGPAPTVFASADALPFRDGSFATALCTEVLEHVPDPASPLREIARALQPRGRLVVSVPFFAPLHEVPNDYRRLTPAGLRRHLGQAGFDVETLRSRGGPVSVLVDLVCKRAQVWLAASLRRLRLSRHARDGALRSLLHPVQAVLASVALLRRSGWVVRSEAGDAQDASLGYVAGARLSPRRSS